MEFIYLFSGVLLGFLIGWLSLRSRVAAQEGVTPDAQRQLELEVALARKESETIREQLLKSQEEMRSLQSTNTALSEERVKAETTAISLAQRLEEQKKDLEAIRTQLKEQFSTIASEVVLKNAQRIQEESKTRLDDILTPLKEKISQFEYQVKTAHEERIRENQSLKEQLSQLQILNKSIGDEAKNLVTALKGQAKTQGNWGEMILEKLLERSGLVKGREYYTQASMVSEEGRRLQPDVIISLPEGRSMVVDSKVSLIAYERYCNEQDDSLRQLAMKEHLSSLRKHVKDLSSKNYQSLYQIQTLDFVLLFVPVESAFALAVDQDHELFTEAFEKNIVIVTTSTLLATLRTIASIWRIEHQNKNALEIARQSGDLYDKFSGLIDDLVTVGKKMKESQGAYESAVNKLHLGKGNLVSRVENLKKLGIKTSRQINQQLLDRTDDLETQAGDTDAAK
jgi:DNA recombination protein RmuC